MHTRAPKLRSWKIFKAHPVAMSMQDNYICWTQMSSPPVETCSNFQ